MILKEKETEFNILPVDVKNYKISVENILNTPESVKDEFLCSFCFYLVLSPKMCSFCNKMFCGNCVDEWNSINLSCIICRKTFIQIKIQKPLLKYLDDLHIKCPCNCGNFMKYKEYPGHIQNCPMINRKVQSLKCPLIMDSNIDMYEVNEHLLTCPNKD